MEERRPRGRHLMTFVNGPTHITNPWEYGCNNSQAFPELMKVDVIAADLCCVDTLAGWPSSRNHINLHEPTKSLLIVHPSTIILRNRYSFEVNWILVGCSLADQIPWHCWIISQSARHLSNGRLPLHCHRAVMLQSLSSGPQEDPYKKELLQSGQQQQHQREWGLFQRRHPLLTCMPQSK